MIATGGMRDRLFFPLGASCNPLGRLLLRNSIRRSMAPHGADYLHETIIRALCRPVSRRLPLNLTKLPLLRWRKGGKFNGGAHHLTKRLPLSRERGVLMHFPLTRGIEGIRYIAERGQHFGNAEHYRAMEAFGHINPVYPGTSRFQGTDKFQGFFL
jgi:hypothetical protein